MTWNLTVYNPTNLNDSLATFEGVKSIDELASLWNDKYNNHFITATKIRNIYHCCKHREEHFIRITKNL